MRTFGSLSAVNPVASIKLDIGTFAVDFSRKDSHKTLTVLFLSPLTGKTIPIAELPVLPRTEIISQIRLIAAYAKAAANLADSQGNLLVSEDALIASLGMAMRTQDTKRTPGRNSKSAGRPAQTNSWK